jgi:hypothetical protein
MRLLPADPGNFDVSIDKQFRFSTSLLIATPFALIGECTRKASTHQIQTTTAFTLSKMAQVSQATKDHKTKYRAIIVGLFSQFDENETLLRECTSRDALSHMSQLCTVIQQRNVDQTSEDRWSHVLNSINEALVKRLRAKDTAKHLSPSLYGLKSDDFRDAQIAAKVRTVNLANLFAMARELDMAENSDGIMARRNASLPSKKTQSLRSSDAASLRSSTTSERALRSDISKLPHPSAPPSDPAGAPGRRLHKTYFNNPRHSDISIVLCDRLVYLHCVVLSRVSECFDLLLENNRQVC